ncbi:Uncharacterised protein [Bacillus tequilensis]|nr:Uncharacterised protein [Bacillus tequilensis]
MTAAFFIQLIGILLFGGDVNSEATITLVAMIAAADSAIGANEVFASANAYGIATAASATPSPHATK